MTISQFIPGAVDVSALTETIDASAPGLAEHPANKGVASGYAPLDSGVLVPEKYVAPQSMSIRAHRRCMSAMGTAALTVSGLPAPTIDAATQSAIEDADGSYFQVASTAALDATAGIYWASLVKPRLLPDVFLSFRAGYASTNVFFGFCSSDPVGLTDFSAVKAIGLFFDYTVYATPNNFIQTVVSDGSTQTIAATALSVATYANARIGLRIRCTASAAASSTWEIGYWDFATSAWVSLTTKTFGSGVSNSTVLGLYLRTKSQNTSAHNLALSHLDLITD